MMIGSRVATWHRHMGAGMALAALGLAVATGVSERTAISALAGLEGVRGRIELAARHPNGAAIFVDYAHTPDALMKVRLRWSMMCSAVKVRRRERPTSRRNPILTCRATSYSLETIV